DEVRHSVLLTILARIEAQAEPLPLWWPLGGPGECAAQMPGYPIMLGDVAPAQARLLAGQTRDLDYAGIVGPERTACWFADPAAPPGATCGEPIPQQIHTLCDKPRYPGAPGHARVATSADAPLFGDWMIAFQREAVPHDPVPSRE